MKGILGRKLGMTQVFTTDGVLIPVTVVEALPNVVLQKKTLENDGYEAVQLGFEDLSEKGSNKAEKGHAAKASTAAKRFVREIRGAEMMNLEVGNEVKVDLFAAGEIVDVTGTSKGRGYNGTIVRNNATMGPKTHGGSKNMRHIGSLATTGRNNGRIEKGTAGAKVATPQRLRIWKSSRLMLKTTTCWSRAMFRDRSADWLLLSHPSKEQLLFRPKI